MRDYRLTERGDTPQDSRATNVAAIPAAEQAAPRPERLLELCPAGIEKDSLANTAESARITARRSSFLLPLLWLVERRWKLILATGALMAMLLAACTIVFGLQVWTDYLGDTLPALSMLERSGTGPFLYMIPSVFISMRLLGADADIASVIHVLCAGLVFALLVWRLFHTADARGRVALVLIATCLVTPYLHIYDLGILLAGALLLLPKGTNELPVLRQKRVLAAITAAWILPILVPSLGLAGLPVSPAIILAIFLAACFPTRSRSN